MLWHFDELSEFARSGHGGFIRDFRSGSIASISALRIEVRSHSWTSHSCHERTHAAQQTTCAHALFDHLVARASTVAGISRPSAFAVLRLITRSYLVGACTGRSAGLSPLRMRST